MGSTPATARLLSLDVFRGFTIAAMVLVNNAGIGPAWGPLKHADWDGLTFTDLVFPFFLWIVGAAMTFSFEKRLAAGASRALLVRHTLRRSAILFALGLALNGFPYYNLATIRIPGVLQRIALCYLVAALIYLFASKRARHVWTFGLLAIYWVLMMYVPVPGHGAGVLDKVGNFGQYVDYLLLAGHLYRPEWDPEGLVTTLPAISTTLFGVWTGELLRSRLELTTKTVRLFLAGNAMILAGLMVSPAMPINKQLWTVSYALAVSGIASVAFAFFYWYLDGEGRTRLTRPFVVYGMNAIAAYVLHGLLGRMLGLIKVTGAGGEPVSLSRFLYQTVYAPLAAPEFATFLYALTHVVAVYGLIAVLDRQKWHLRI